MTIDYTPFRNKTLPKIREGLVSKLHSKTLDADDIQFRIFEQYAPNHPILNVCRAYIAIKQDELPTAISQLFSIDLEVDNDAAWFALDLAKQLFSMNALQFNESYQFMSGFEERRRDVFDDYRDWIKEELILKMRRGQAIAEHDPDFEFLQFFETEEYIINLVYAYSDASRMGRGVLQRLNRLDCIADEEITLITLTLYQTLFEHKQMPECEAESFCRRCVAKYYNSSLITSKVREMFPSIVPEIKRESSGLTMLRGGAA